MLGTSFRDLFYESLKARPRIGTNSISDLPGAWGMFQPLSRVKRSAFVRHDPHALDDKPEMAMLVAKIFAHWGLIEHRLSLLLVRVLGADAAPALAMFATLTAQHLQTGALEAAAKAALSEDEFAVFRAALGVTDSVQTPRNQLAHWIWASAPELENALLLAEPKSAKERDREFTLAMETGKRPFSKWRFLIATIQKRSP
jgi:hypothetical protein